LDLTPLIPAGRQIVESYGHARFRVTGTLYEGSVIVFPDRTIIWSVGDAAGVNSANLEAVSEAGRAGRTDLLLLGCGAKMTLVPSSLRAALREAGVVVEPMDTGAACRTYNVLMAEGRHVAAALIAVE
jgi:uncharacterized protein